MNKDHLYVSEIRSRFQITIPEEIRKQASLDIGDSLLWQYDQVTEEIHVIPRPDSFTESLWGLGKHIWENGEQDTQSSDDYIQKERDSW